MATSREEVNARRIIQLSLVLLTLAVFAQTSGFKFITVDDIAYVAHNDWVLQGLSVDSVRWAFTTFRLGHWHPLTHLSYMANASVFGSGPGGFHLVNVLLHIGSTLLLFSVLHRATSNLYPSAFVAALFAVHPFHVESVCWISERKDVLSVFFATASLRFYVSYASERGKALYGASIVSFVFAVLSKASLAPLPCVMLLMDLWPLGRMSAQEQGGRRWTSWMRPLVLEKLPYFGIAFVGIGMAIWADPGDYGRLPFTYRIETALTAYGAYVQKTFWPTGLIAFYPHLGSAIDSLRAYSIAIAMTLFSAFACVNVRKRPYIFVGWFWFVGTIFPMSGLFQGLGQFMADRYTYFALTGISICVAWGAQDVIARHANSKRLLGSTALCIVAICAVLSYRQARLWRDTVTLYRYTEERTPPNQFVRSALGIAYLYADRPAEAQPYWEAYIELTPGSSDAHAKLGEALERQGQWVESRPHYLRALELDPENAFARRGLANVCLEVGDGGCALEHYLILSKLYPEDWRIWCGLGIAYAMLSDSQSALESFQTALTLDESNVVAHYNLATIYQSVGDETKALDHVNRVVELDPDHEAAQALLRKLAADVLR